jgi:GTP-binding protein
LNPFSTARYTLSAGKPADFPPEGPVEIVFAGRSNVGKSSAINALTGRKRLAFTSKTPGRTQTINFYELDIDARLVDLPGYGFARVPKPMRAQWEELVGGYLGSRTSLAAVVVTMDARHPLTPLDLQLLGWLRNQRVLMLLTKADKLSRRDQEATLQAVREQTATRPGDTDALLFSSLTRQGVENCRDLLQRWLQARV